MGTVPPRDPDEDEEDEEVEEEEDHADEPPVVREPDEGHRRTKDRYHVEGLLAALAWSIALYQSIGSHGLRRFD